MLAGGIAAAICALVIGTATQTSTPSYLADLLSSSFTQSHSGQGERSRAMKPKASFLSRRLDSACS